MHPKVQIHGSCNKIKDQLEKQAQAGRAILVKAVDNGGLAADACQIAQDYDVDSLVIMRWVNLPGYPEGIPNYAIEPVKAGNDIATAIKLKLSQTPELRPYYGQFYVSIFNEIRTQIDPDSPNYNNMHPVEWIAIAGQAAAQSLLAIGVSSTVFSFNAGTPEPEDWLRFPGMVSFLKFASENRDNVLIDFHEGFIGGDLDDDWIDYYPHLIGRFVYMIEACDYLEIERCRFVISEFAFNYADMPGQEHALGQIRGMLTNVYQPFLSFGTLFLWTGDYLGVHKPLANKVCAFANDKLWSFILTADLDVEIDEPGGPSGPGSFDNILFNPSFEFGWQNLPPGPGDLINQQPAGWKLEIIPIGQQAWDFVNAKTGDPVVTTGIPEATHKHNNSLPEDEQAGGPKALVLDGNYVYKIFASNMIHASRLVQVIVDLEPNAWYRFTVPVQVHYNNILNEPDDVEVRLEINGIKRDILAKDLPDRKYVYLDLDGQANEDGIAVVHLYSVTKWANSRDFFYDDLSFSFVRNDVPDAPDPECRGLPREQYKRIYWVYHDSLTESQRLELYRRAAVAQRTIGPSFDDSGLGDLNDKTAICFAVPESEKQEFIDFYEQYYPGTKIEFRPFEEPPQDPFVGLQFGQPLSTIYILTSKFNDSREYANGKHEGVDYAPHVHLSTPSYVLALLDGKVTYIGFSPEGYGNYIIVEHYYNGVQFFIYHAHMSATFVSVNELVSQGQPLGICGDSGRATGRHVHLTWKTPGYGLDGYVVDDVRDPLPHMPTTQLPAPEPKVDLEFGIHDESGANWMRANDVSGYSIHSVALKEHTTIDFSSYAAAGIKMLVRLNWGYKPEGTLPSPNNKQDQDMFVHACLETMKTSKGIWGWVIGNEFNNPNEFPNGTHLEPAYVAAIYNRIWLARPTSARLTIGATDPYYGPGSDNRKYWTEILAKVNGLSFLTYHPKTQDSDPDNVDSNAKFSDDPLKWQYLHLRSYQPLMEVVPIKFKNLPVIMSEVNPQRKNNGQLGWQISTSAEWVRRAAAHFDNWNKQPGTTKVQGVIFYRWNFDEWAMKDLNEALGVIKGL